MSDLSVSEISGMLEAMRQAASAAVDQGDPGATLHELCAAWKCDDKTARKRLRPLVLAGTVVCGRAKRPKIDGNVQLVPVYRTVA